MSHVKHKPQYHLPLQVYIPFLLDIVLINSNFNCNSPSSPLADIVRFDSLRIDVNLTILKHIGFPHPYKVRCPLQTIWDLTIHLTFTGVNVLTGTLPSV